MKVAVVHDWLPFWGGAESVLEQILECYPGADLYTICDFLDSEQRARLKCGNIHTSFIQRMPFARKRFWYYLPWMPYAIEQFDLSEYDLVISSSHTVAKGVLTKANQVHVSYVHSPMRYAWDLYHVYLQQAGYGVGPRRWFARWMLHYLRIWDLRTTNGVDCYIANSNFVAQRIWKTYRREASVVYPPVESQQVATSPSKDEFYFCASRHVSYKRIDLVVDAFRSMPDKKLVIAGDGPELGAIQRAAPTNVTVLGYLPRAQLFSHMQRARAFVFAAEEDFGIVTVEAQACGTPVVAFGGGGTAETVITADSPNPTGVLFAEQTAEAIAAGVRQFEANETAFTRAACEANARRFSADRFRLEFRTAVDAQIAARRRGRDKLPVETQQR